jgi:hypothetical protein
MVVINYFVKDIFSRHCCVYSYLSTDSQIKLTVVNYIHWSRDGLYLSILTAFSISHLSFDIDQETLHYAPRLDNKECNILWFQR